MKKPPTNIRNVLLAVANAATAVYFGSMMLSGIEFILYSGVCGFLIGLLWAKLDTIDWENREGS